MANFPSVQGSVRLVVNFQTARPALWMMSANQATATERISLEQGFQTVHSNALGTILAMAFATTFVMSPIVVLTTEIVKPLAIQTVPTSLSTTAFVTLTAGLQMRRTALKTMAMTATLKTVRRAADPSSVVTANAMSSVLLKPAILTMVFAVELGSAAAFQKVRSTR